MPVYPFPLLSQTSRANNSVGQRGDAVLVLLATLSFVAGGGGKGDKADGSQWVLC